MFLFPIAYLIAFLKTLKGFAKKQAGALLIFICIGLPIYIHSLSVTYMYGWDQAIGVLQSFKELVVLIALGLVIWQLKQRPRFTKTDWMVLAFMGYTLFFVVLPIGSYDIKSKLLAFKSLSFFSFLYFVGRCIDAKQVLLSKAFKYIGIMTMLAALLALYEYASNQHIHTQTGYIDFLIHYFDDEVTGNYGLTWSFETETGLKRFGSIFGNPLEMGASILLSLSLVLSFYTNAKNKLVFSKFGSLFFVASLICIFLALSRASFLGYLMMVVVYAFMVKNRWLIRLLYFLLTITIVYFIYFITQNDVYAFVVETVTFTNASSVGHVLEWIDGINAMINKPMGMGLGESGRLSMFTKENTGGENQFIITGVQVGVPMLILYISIHVSIAMAAYKNSRTAFGKLKRIAMALFLFKIGILVPMFTANTESYIYVSYLTWFLSGLMINLIQRQNQVRLNN
jgi:hypothetical protein